MDIRRTKYLSSKSYIGKITVIPSEQEKELFRKYSEPIVEVGGSMTDGNITFSLTDSERRIYTDSPFSQTFDTVSLGIDYTEAGERADIFLDTLQSRMKTLMDDLRNTDATTNSEIDKIIVI